MTEPVRMLFTAELLNAPKDVQAAWAMQQAMDFLNLTDAERKNVLYFLLRRIE